MYLRLRYKQLGGHIHCRMFTAQIYDGTWAKNGDLVFDEKEWPDVQGKLARVGEVLPEAHHLLDEERGE